jgi:predicted metal-dependent peptidase
MTTEIKVDKKDTLKDFLFDIQKKKPLDPQADAVRIQAEERKNILNLKILVIVDISGSISLEQYNSFMSQLNKIRGLSMVKVIETDTKVVAMYDYYKGNHARIVKLGGGGGTDFFDAFQYGVKTNPDAIVCLTDGDESGRVHKPSDVPVAWVLTAHGHAPYQWGKVITKVDR